MIDLISEIAFALTPVLGVCTFVWSLWEFRAVSTGRRVLASLLFACTVAWVSYSVAIAFAWRDGLGPDSVPSSGAEAVQLAFEGLWALPLIALGPILLGAWLLRRATPTESLAASTPTTGRPGTG
jgi:hypothetical protein